MFDIDGTLVNSNDFDEECYLRAAETVLSVRISSDWAGYQHATDSGILNEVIDRYKIPGSKEQIRNDFKKVFIDLVSEYIGNNPRSVSEVEGAACFIKYLCKHENCKVAIATGGWEETAKLKLKAAGIDIKKCAFASSSEHNSRVNIMKAAELKASSSVPFISKIYFGDASWDKHASELLNYRFILVGSRIDYKYQIQNFKDLEAILSILNL